jgi:hypothetical protein
MSLKWATVGILRALNSPQQLIGEATPRALRAPNGKIKPITEALNPERTAAPSQLKEDQLNKPKA